MSLKIEMRGPVGDFEGGYSAAAFKEAIKDAEGDLEIVLDSEGGVVTEGLAIYNAMAAYPGNITVTIDTVAASIATVIACAADRVQMNDNAIYMIHRCWTAAAGNALDFRKTADIMEMLDSNIAGVYAGKTGLEEEPILQMMTDETWMDAAEAFNSGFVDGVNEIKKKKKPQASNRRKYQAIARLAAWNAHLSR